MAQHRQDSFGDLLVMYRTAARLTQEELAEQAELSVRGLRYLERGMRRPYRDTIERLARALDLDPERRRALFAAAHAVPTYATGRGTLPIPPTPLIGRQAEVQSAIDLLQSDEVRVVTVTGPGGVGKTRLALEVASGVQSAFADGLVWVPLAALRDASLVSSAIAQACQVVETGSLSPEQLVQDSLRNRHVLLLLDNFEHVAAAATFVGQVIESCARVKVLVTSRAPIRLRAEYEFTLSPLELPDAAGNVPVHALAANPSVDLFLRRAQSVRPAFVLARENALDVAAICRRLEGLPLAIELAAARIRVLTPANILARLEHRLSFLRSAMVDVPERQRTMREAIAWSYDLLELNAQRLFQRLAVFAGGCDLSAIEMVCTGFDGADIDVLGAVEDLHRNSLVRLAESTTEEPRITMLETVREYAQERLIASSELEIVAARHASFYVDLADATAQQFFTSAQGAWFARMEQEHDNLRAAVNWCIQNRMADLGLRLAAGAWTFWYVRGYAEGAAYIAALLALPDATTVMAPRATALMGASQLALARGDYAYGRPLLQDSVALFRELRDERGTADALLCAGFLARVEEDYPTARSYLDEALALALKIEYAFIVGTALHHLGLIAVDADGNLAEAQRLYERSLMVFRTLGAPRSVGLVATALADVLRIVGDYEQARALLREAIKAMDQIGDNVAHPIVLDTYAHLAYDMGQPEWAVRLAAAALHTRRITGVSAWPTGERNRTRWLAEARAAIGGVAYSAAWEFGEAMTQDEIIASTQADLSQRKRPAT